MSGMAAEIAARMAADGVDTRATVDDAMGGSPAQGTGGDPTPVVNDPTPSAGTSNAGGQGAGTPDTIPYSRFTEVNSRLQQLKPYENLERMGIDPDSAVRLASFEQAYMQDPRGTIASLVDSQQDLPDAQKAALKALLAQSGSVQDGALAGDGDEGDGPQLPAEVMEAVNYVRELRSERENTETKGRLDHMLGHWQQLDSGDGVEATPQQRLLYVQAALGSGRQFQTLEQAAETARTLWLSDRDANLGAAVTRRGTGAPLAVPSGGLPPTQAITPRTMGDARKLILADIAAGRLPDLGQQ